ncbi:Lachesin-like 1 [Homarus americanus]|uniref:Lachesin-like 1 n=1 Tax=Homarus americanus TaxID=6706 RepID=A0A8J5K3X6_HOMAM|nr:Lachesin-like 1 [Homarus americanus]
MVTNLYLTNRYPCKENNGFKGNYIVTPPRLQRHSLTSSSSLPHVFIVTPPRLHRHSLTSSSSLPHVFIVTPSRLHRHSPTSSSSLPHDPNINSHTVPMDRHVEWRREANLTFPDGSIMMGGQSVLLEYVGREDAGIYVCTARNSLGRTHSTALTIHVHYPPVVGVWARDVGVSDVELGCLVEGRPRPSLAWYRNNTRLSPPSCHGNVELHSSVLSPAFLLAIVRVSNTSEADFAYYHCRATNSVGISRAYVMLHDDSGGMSLDKLKPKVVTKYRAVENPRLASFLVGMVPPLYIALYIIAYLGCYKTSLTGGGGHGRFGTSMDLDQ